MKSATSPVQPPIPPGQYSDRPQDEVAYFSSYHYTPSREGRGHNNKCQNREDIMRRLGVSLVGITLAAGLIGSALAQAKEPIALRDIGSFHLGGRYVDISGKPTREVTIGGATQTLNPNGTYLVEQMYVQYLLPQNRKGKVPLLMWHGGGFTGVTYESTPDGREGWLNIFVRKGWDSYVSDAIQAAYDQLVDRVCPCVLLVHSQSGAFGYAAALKRPDKVKALVIVEGTIRGDATTAATLKNNVDKSPMFSAQLANNRKMAELAKAAGGSIEIVSLPDLGIKGNSHFAMMEKNNAEVAEIVH